MLGRRNRGVIVSFLNYIISNYTSGALGNVMKQLLCKAADLSDPSIIRQEQWRTGVTRVGVTWGGNLRCHPYFISEKLTTFYSHRRLSVLQCTVSPLFFPDKLTTFLCSWLSLLLISLGCHPLEGVTPHLFLLVRPHLFTVLCKFIYKKFPFGCHPLEGVTRGGSPPPKDATGQAVVRTAGDLTPDLPEIKSWLVCMYVYILCQAWSP